MKKLIDDGLRFDAILTNPPFATSYTAKDEHEKRILSQYRFSDDLGAAKEFSIS